MLWKIPVGYETLNLLSLKYIAMIKLNRAIDLQIQIAQMAELENIHWISDHSLHAFSGKCLETSPDGRTDMPQNGHGWSDGPTDPCTGEKRLFQASDGRTDNPKT